MQPTASWEAAVKGGVAQRRLRLGETSDIGLVKVLDGSNVGHTAMPQSLDMPLGIALSLLALEKCHIVECLWEK